MTPEPGGAWGAAPGVRQQLGMPPVNTFFRHAGAALLLAATAFSTAAVAELYKWTDNRGVVHYGDRIPPEYANRANSVLNRQGVTIKSNDAALTPEQVRERDEALVKQREVIRIQAEERRKALALLQSYESEDEIEVLRERAAKQVEQAITASEKDLGELVMKKARLETDRTGYVKTPPPDKLLREIEFTDKEIARQKKAIEAQHQELEQVNARYEGDKARYREAKAKYAIAPVERKDGAARDSAASSQTARSDAARR